MKQDEAFIEALVADYTTAPMNPADRAMLDYTVKLTKTPAEIVRADVDGLAAHGFTERAILDICQVAAYFAFVNRLADGLGVELEEGVWTDEPLPKYTGD